MKEFFKSIIENFPIRLVIILGLASGIIIAPLAFLGLTGFTRTSETYYKSCHENRQDADIIFKSSSAHPGSIRCVDCHIENTSNLISNLYFADDEFLTERCLSCHAPVLKGNVDDLKIQIFDQNMFTGELSEKSLQDYKLKEMHSKHIEKNIQCIDCHRNIQHDWFEKQVHVNPNRPRIEYCIQCHPNDNYANREYTPVMKSEKE